MGGAREWSAARRRSLRDMEGRIFFRLKVLLVCWNNEFFCLCVNTMKWEEHIMKTFDIKTFDVTKFDRILSAGLSSGLGERGGQVCIEAAICQTLGLPHGDDPG